ncbi:MAG: hypothetical protein JWR24_2129 [Actinoallomurus sp.]|jgi:hypothetical protein|nr:hypothetical protein [Actinoallomurus sp.]
MATTSRATASRIEAAIPAHAAAAVDPHHSVRDLAHTSVQVVQRDVHGAGNAGAGAFGVASDIQDDRLLAVFAGLGWAAKSARA